MSKTMLLLALSIILLNSKSGNHRHHSCEVFREYRVLTTIETFGIASDKSCYKLIRAAVMANNLTNVNRRLMWLDEADAEKTLLLVLLGVAKNQRYITQKKLLELQGKLEEIGRIIGGLQKFFINNRK